jgi:sugar phosphate isomerase/epimerase
MPRTSLSYPQPTQIGFAASSGPVERYFPLAQRHDVSWLEFGCQNPVNFPQTFDHERIRRIRHLMERSQIRCGLHSASFVNSAEIMPMVRKAAEEHLKEYIDLAAALRCEYLVIHCGFHFSVYLERVWAALCETFARAVEHAERRRIPLVIENMNRLPAESEFQYLGVTVEEFTDLFRRIRSPYLGLALDVAHCHLLPGGVARFVRSFPEQIREVQLSDNHGTVDQHLTIGEGTVDFSRVFQLLRGIHFSGPLIIELTDIRKKLRSRSRLLRLLKAEGHGKTKVIRREPQGEGHKRREN